MSFKIMTIVKTNFCFSIAWWINIRAIMQICDTKGRTHLTCIAILCLHHLSFKDNWEFSTTHRSYFGSTHSIVFLKNIDRLPLTNVWLGGNVHRAKKRNTNTVQWCIASFLHFHQGLKLATSQDTQSQWIPIQDFTRTSTSEWSQLFSRCIFQTNFSTNAAINEITFSLFYKRLQTMHCCL